MSDAVHSVEHFHGVYLLYCKNPQYKGRTYLGYTVDPNRRLKQHNKGKRAGGAWRTSKRGPWAMVLIIHGFPNDIAALRFEWAWQHPQSSRRLNHLAKKKAKEKTYDYVLRILSEMLRVGPWNRLPLTVRWLEQEYARDFPADKMPPIHMPVCYGPVVSKKLPKSPLGETAADEEREQANNGQCGVCRGAIGGKAMSCLNAKCELLAHVVCLSRCFLQVGEYVPVEGACPKCGDSFLWGDLVRKYKGCYAELNFNVDGGDRDFCSSDSD